MKPERVGDKALAEKWDRVLRVRGELTKGLEIARRDKVIGHSLEAEVVVAEVVVAMTVRRWGRN